VLGPRLAEGCGENSNFVTLSSTLSKYRHFFDKLGDKVNDKVVMGWALARILKAAFQALFPAMRLRTSDLTSPVPHLITWLRVPGDHVTDDVVIQLWARDQDLAGLQP